VFFVFEIQWLDQWRAQRQTRRQSAPAAFLGGRSSSLASLCSSRGKGAWPLTSMLSAVYNIVVNALPPTQGSPGLRHTALTKLGESRNRRLKTRMSRFLGAIVMSPSISYINVRQILEPRLGAAGTASKHHRKHKSSCVPSRSDHTWEDMILRSVCLNPVNEGSTATPRKFGKFDEGDRKCQQR
jgi:hypothetical protein